VAVTAFPEALWAVATGAGVEGNEVVQDETSITIPTVVMRILRRRKSPVTTV